MFCDFINNIKKTSQLNEKCTNTGFVCWEIQEIGRRLYYWKPKKKNKSCNFRLYMIMNTFLKFQNNWFTSMAIFGNHY